jgi:hypothetical protein
MMKRFIAFGMILILLSGCATTSRLLNLKGQPPASALFPNDEDIAEVIEEIKEKPAPKSNAVTWTGKGYLVTPEAWEKVLNDKIYLMALKKKVEAFAKDYRPETLRDAWRKDLGTSIITILLMLGIVVY